MCRSDALLASFRYGAAFMAISIDLFLNTVIPGQLFEGSLINMSGVTPDDDKSSL